VGGKKQPEWVIREAKKQYGRNLEKNIEDIRDTSHLWQGFQTVMGYKHPAKTAQCNNRVLFPV